MRKQEYVTRPFSFKTSMASMKGEGEGRMIEQAEPQRQHGYKDSARSLVVLETKVTVSEALNLTQMGAARTSAIVSH